MPGGPENLEGPRANPHKSTLTTTRPNRLILSQRVRDPGPSRDEGLDKILQLLDAGASPCLGSSTLEAPVHHQSTSS